MAADSVKMGFLANAIS